MAPGLFEDLDFFGAGRGHLFRTVGLVAKGDVGYHAQVQVFVPLEMEAGAEGVFAKTGEIHFLGNPQHHGLQGQGHLLAKDRDRVRQGR